MPLKVLHPLPTIGLELYQLGGTNEGIKRKCQCMADVLFIFCGFNSFAFVEWTTVLLVWSIPNQSNRRSVFWTYNKTSHYDECSLPKESIFQIFQIFVLLVIWIVRQCSNKIEGTPMKRFHLSQNVQNWTLHHVTICYNQKLPIFPWKLPKRSQEEFTLKYVIQNSHT